MLKKLLEELNEMNRLSQVYYEHEQWALLEKIMIKIKVWSNMIINNLEENERKVPEEN